MLRSIAGFIKTSIFGGVLVLLPLYLSSLLLLKMLFTLQALIKPITSGLPETLRFPQFIAALSMVFLCFVCGIVVRTAIGAHLIKFIERRFLEKLPGYVLIRGLTGRIVGKEDEESFTVVLAEIEEALVPAFLIEDCGYDQCVIFIPSVPTPTAGAIYIINRNRVHLVDVPFSVAVRVISKWGSGAKALLDGMKSAERNSLIKRVDS
jgi:uncharacterized membrane protein